MFFYQLILIPGLHLCSLMHWWRRCRCRREARKLSWGGLLSFRPRMTPWANNLRSNWKLQVSQCVQLTYQPHLTNNTREINANRTGYKILIKIISRGHWKYSNWYPNKRLLFVQYLLNPIFDQMFIAGFIRAYFICLSEWFLMVWQRENCKRSESCLETQQITVWTWRNQIEKLVFLVVS